MRGCSSAGVGAVSGTVSHSAASRSSANICGSTSVSCGARGGWSMRRRGRAMRMNRSSSAGPCATRFWSARRVRTVRGTIPDRPHTAQNREASDFPSSARPKGGFATRLVPIRDSYRQLAWSATAYTCLQLGASVETCCPVIAPSASGAEMETTERQSKLARPLTLCFGYPPLGQSGTEVAANSRLACVSVTC